MAMPTARLASAPDPESAPSPREVPLPEFPDSRGILSRHNGGEITAALALRLSRATKRVPTPPAEVGTAVLTAQPLRMSGSQCSGGPAAERLMTPCDVRSSPAVIRAAVQRRLVVGLPTRADRGDRANPGRRRRQGPARADRLWRRDASGTRRPPISLSGRPPEAL